MTPEQKQRLSSLGKQHAPYNEGCDVCFLLTLLDQAQRDTERVERGLADIQKVCNGEHQVSESDTEALQWIYHEIEAIRLDQAALARGEGEK